MNNHKSAIGWSSWGGMVAAFFLFSLTAGSGAIFAQERGLAVIAREATGDAKFDVGRQYAVVIGIDRYKEWPSLRNAVSEAKAVRKILGERYYIDEFFELYDDTATAANIRRLFMDTLPGKIGIKDSLLVFYAGHGQLDSTKTGFWIASDGTKDVYTQYNWIPNSQLRNMIGNLKAQRILILADACFSGDFLNVSRGAVPVVDSAYYRKALQLTARQVLTSGASESVPDESEFGRQLINILERNEESLLDPIGIYERLKRGVTKTLPLLGTMPGNEEGASFVLFLKNSTSTAAVQTGQTTSLTPAGTADLMVRTGIAGAEIYVDGVLQGRTPLLLEKLPAGRGLKVETKTATLGGSVEVSLQAGELREVTVPLAARTGHLLITANETAVRFFIDGNEIGPLGGGIFRDLPAGTHTLELVGQGLYWTAKADLAPESTTKLDARVQGVGRLEINAPADAAVKISGIGAVYSAAGNGVFDRLPAGSYVLSATGPGYEEAKGVVQVQKGLTASWTAWETGQVEFTVLPGNGSFTLEGGTIQGAAKGKISGFKPGRQTIRLSAPGYHEKAIEVTVAAGKTSLASVNLERLAQGAVTLPAYGVDLILECRTAGETKTITGRSDGSGAIRYDGIPAGLPVKINFKAASAAMANLDTKSIDLELAENEARRLELPSGRVTLPWLPTGAQVAIGGFGLPSDKAVAEVGGEMIVYHSPLLPAGTYQVKISGKYPFSSTAVVSAGKETELTAYRASVLASLSSERTKAATKISGRQTAITAGWISLATGIVGAAGTGAVYFLGNAVMKDYLAASDSATAEKLWNTVSLYRILFPVSAAIGGVGLGLSPFLLGGSDPAALKQSLEALDEEIESAKR